MDVEPVPDVAADAVMRGARALIAITARSLADVEDVISLLQWRVLVLISTRGPQTPTLVAEDLGIHRSNATRICDRLVRAGFVEKQDDRNDGRVQQIALTTAGRDLIEGIMARRRVMIGKVMQGMEPAARGTLALSLEAFASSAGEMTEGPIPGVLGLGG
ncbi:MarR family transcriptional regulator (plasmid) [Arthrobacter agilis]|uniref:MarR family winged helix-turn-helix transcriptional regulator n=1 Tax=Arthrobacter agilis TaxID=37921 RepID=UPI002365D5DF|nr:MarR family transcriptional regulator [Arthrobacter agilis]WDF35114.1 MarR family transcriptional regulator [Arthrobacter agilis]